MASIRKRGDRYDVRWRDVDGSERTRTCPTLASARQLKRDVEEARALGRRWTPGEAAAAATLTEALDAYIATRATRKRASTVRTDDAAIRRFIEWARPRGRRTDVLTVEALTAFDVFLRTEAGLMVRSANAYTLKVRRWMAWLAVQPQHRAFVEQPPDPRLLDLPDAPWAPPHAPRWAEMDAAVDAATRPWVGDALWVARCTGLRSNQVMGLRWDDFHVDGRDGVVLHVRGELGKSKQERAGRVIPVTPHLLERFAGRPREGWLVAPHKEHRKIGQPLAEAAWVASGMPERVWRGHPNHCFRYGFESGLKAAGADYQAIEHLTGHAVQGAGSSYLDTRWALKLREAVDLVPPRSTAVQVEAAKRGMGVR